MAIKIFDIQYLIENELTDDDLHYLFDCHSLQYSLIAYMFKVANYKFNNEDLIKKLKKDKKWVYKYYWTRKQRNKFESNVIKAIKNIYIFSDEVARKWVEMFSIYYGLSVKDNNIDK